MPLGPASVDITGVRAGDKNLMTITLSTGGVPMDLTDMQITAQARLTPLDANSITAVIEVSDPTKGTIAIRWPGDEVAAIMVDKPTWEGVWDLQVGESGEDPVTVAAGTFSAVMDVTRP